MPPLYFNWILLCRLLITSVGLMHGAHSTLYGPVEVCNRNRFNASCDRPDEVLLMHSARYGRMKMGGCVKENFGYLGCNVDVLGHLDSRCSGMHQCQFLVPDDTLYATKPCPGDTTMYLEVRYNCIKVAVATRHQCYLDKTLTLKDKAGYISSAVTDNFGYGSPTCPWVIQGQPGQRINLTMLNFLRHVPPPKGDGSTALVPRPVCYEVANIKDGSVKTNLVSCNKEKREQPAYLSTSHQVEVVFPKRNQESITGAFLLKYELEGCTDVKAPRGAHVTVTSRTAAVRCNNTGETWYLKCVGSSWEGKLGNCSHAAGTSETPWSLSSIFAPEEEFPFGILIAVALGVALGVFLGGLLLTLVVIHSKRKRRSRGRQDVRSVGTESTNPSSNYTTTSTSSSKFTRQWSTNETKLLAPDTGTGLAPSRDLIIDSTRCPLHEADMTYQDATLGRQRAQMYESPKFV